METRGVLEVVMHDLPNSWPEEALASAGFLRPFLPLEAATPLAPLSVGGTPLLNAKGLGSHLGLKKLMIKDDTRNPSGSTKDRASLLVAAKAIEYGFQTIAAASTGNAATALSAIAAAAGLDAVLFVPCSAPRAKLVQMASYGARLIPVDGSYDDAFELCLKACQHFGWYNRNTALNPFTIEGKKTAALEIAAQMAPDEPDVVIVPTGDGVILSGIAKGFADLVACGLMRRIPRLIVVQPEGSSAIARALISGAANVAAMPGAHSVADSLVVAMPRNARLCLKRVRESGGTGVIVTDDAIIEAISTLARTSGVFAEPAAAATVAGLEIALAQGLVNANDSIVLMITGTGLKDIDTAGKAIKIPEAIPPDIAAIKEPT